MINFNSLPAPLPKSSTISPGCRFASATGLAQPSDARTASSGKFARSSARYPFAVAGGVAQHAPAPQPQPPIDFLVTRRAILP